ncbi:MAG: DVUA0089 family protein [Bryobacteraceae bacterium]
MFAALRAFFFSTCLATSVFAAGFSFSGTFNQDNDLAYFQVNMGASGVLTIQTYGYAGGLNQAGQTIADGGFAPALSVFDSTGTLIAVDNLGGSVPNCNGRGIDPTTGYCFDAIVYDSASVPLTLGAGIYTVVLSQQGNISFGDLTLGFTYDPNNGNDPSFTGTNTGNPGQMFVDPFGPFIRNGNWAVDFVSDSLRSVVVEEVPEPATIGLTLFAALGFAALRRRHYEP